MSSVSGVVHPITEPLPVLEARPTFRATFAALRVANFRLYFAGLAATSASGWLARLATDSLMIELTGDVGLVSLVVAFQLVPSLVLAPWGGVLSDRFAPRQMVVLTQLLVILSALCLGVPAILGTAGVPLIVASSLVLGVSAAFEAPARAVLLVQVVGTRALPNAMSLNAAVQQLAGILGALLTAGLVAIIGPGWALVAAPLGPLAGIVMLLGIRRSALHPAIKVAARRGQILEAVRYVRRKPEIRTALLLITFLAFFALTASILMAWSAKERYGLGTVGYTLFQTASAVGALLGSLLAARRRELRLRDTALLLAGSGLVWACSGLAPVAALFVVGLVAAMLMRTAFMVGNDSLTQLSTNGAIRGRVVSLYVMCMTGAQAAGALATGWSVHALGGELTFLLAGGVPALVALVVVVVLTVRGRSRRPVAVRA
ncbi:MFS transporter [Microbacterium capsulatum]|uniref:MFS transporter n=1 Tax=Microbacterium capsulatum TaxID=3041921 RepID=A0ABU0XL95_9MICO|nr:MFS transporter [Microbacterium sp. ASV81]MDQ4215617.1 MFS transporter [Microbacterium sp. ASV81]